MPSARDKLITDNMRLVYHMYKTIGDGPIKDRYKEDIISEGMLGLVKAADSFDERHGVRFSTYATMCIRNAMLMFIRKTKKHDPHEVSLYEVIGKDIDGKNLILADVIEDEIITRIMIDEFEKRQSPIDQRIMRELKLGKRQVEIARAVGMSQAQVSKRIRNMRKKFQK